MEKNTMVVFIAPFTYFKAFYCSNYRKYLKSPLVENDPADKFEAFYNYRIHISCPLLRCLIHFTMQVTAR